LVTSRAKLTVYFGEHDDIDGELLGVFARHGVEASVLLRGSEGFGIKHHLHSERLLTLSEDLPLVAIAVDSRERILDDVLPEVSELAGDGLVTIENARSDGPPPDRGDVKLTVLCGRAERVGRGPAFVAVVDLLHRHGVEGATVLLGLDGTVHGERRRARFFAGNADVPLVVVAVGDATRVRLAAAELDRLLERPLMTFEGVTMGRLAARSGSESASESAWQKLTVYSSEQAKLGGRPLHVELIRRLRAAGAEGATCLRGIWGYHADLPPHGDRLLSLRRRVPVVTTVVCETPNAERWFGIASEAADAGGLVTSEGVPAARAAGPGVSRGTLRFP
jgi:PII-like signaling protein